MSVLPARSAGVLLSPVGSEVIAYDLVTARAFWLNAQAGEVLAACDGVTDADSSCIIWSEATGTPVEQIAEGVTAVVFTFGEEGLLGRVDNSEPPEVPMWGDDPVPHERERWVGLTHAVIDDRVAFRSSDRALVDAVDVFLGSGSANVTPTLLLDVEAGSTGGLRLSGHTTTHAASVTDLLGKVPMVLNELAAATCTSVTFHAGGVRSPTGEVVLFPAPSGSGKSTLTAALVSAGWDYLSDEAVAVRTGALTAVGYPKPLSLSAVSRDVLGLPPELTEYVRAVQLRPDVRQLDGEVGAVDRVVLPTYSSGAHTDLVGLDAREAVTGLLGNTFNLGRVGQDGLDTLCRLAERVPVQRLVYGDVGAAVGAVAAG